LQLGRGDSEFLAHTQVAELSKQVDKTLKAQQKAASLKEELKVRCHVCVNFLIFASVSMYVVRNPHVVSFGHV
jgi:hypothetical protein